MNAVKVAFAVGTSLVFVASVLGSKNLPSVVSTAHAAQIVEMPQADPVSPNSPTETIPNNSSKSVYELRLVSFNCSSQYGYTTTQGIVRNISSAPINSLVAVSQIYSANGTFIKSDMGIVDYQPLMPGQTSPFKVMTSYNPMGSKCLVNFKRMFGGAVAFTDK